MRVRPTPPRCTSCRFYANKLCLHVMANTFGVQHLAITMRRTPLHMGGCSRTAKLWEGKK